MATEGKGDLKLLGEIDKRVALLGPTGVKILHHALSERAAADQMEIVRQIVERHAALSPDGKAYADKKLGVDAPESKDVATPPRSHHKEE